MPAPRKISSVRGFTTWACGARCGPSRRSTPRLESSSEVTRPTGPAPTMSTGTSTRVIGASLRAAQAGHRGGENRREDGEDDEVLVDAEDLHVRVGQGDHAAVEGREQARDPEAREVRRLPVDGEPQVAEVARPAEPDQVE